VWIVNGKSGHSLAERSAVTQMADVWDYWRRHSRQFEDITAYNAFFAYDSYRLTGSGEPSRLVGVQVSRNFLSVLGVAPHIGRFFSESEMLQGGPRAIVLSHGLWRRQFASDPSVVGRSVVIDGKGATVVGVLPRSTFRRSSLRPPVWTFSRRSCSRR
jgi:MacB-like periplasmic core domain